MRYENLDTKKINGVVYTPPQMADYLAKEMIVARKTLPHNEICILDPAMGEGILILSLLRILYEKNPKCNIHVVGYETNIVTAQRAKDRILKLFPVVELVIRNEDFLEAVDAMKERYDFVIANPPYVRTQILGAEKAQKIAHKSELEGKVDIYYAFLVCTKNVLKADGVAGYITSNKFLTIKSGNPVRNFMLENYKVHRVTDFGDTKLFSAAVLPCILVFSLGKNSSADSIRFTSVYETQNTVDDKNVNKNIFDKIDVQGTFLFTGGRKYKFQQGTLHSIAKGALWTISSKENNEWLQQVESHTWLRFSDIGKIRVGIKTTADNVFIGDKWEGEKSNIELLQPLITHRDAGRIIPTYAASWKVLYTHYDNNGKRAVYDIDQFPNAKKYLESHYEQLASRKYLEKAHRNWYEIWVPQNPASWRKRKIVFRDISETPQFWLDETGAVVNGDCYWIEIDDSVFEDVVYLALAVANSSFIEEYYDVKFNTKLYSGKRRFMTQYVEQFPIPFPDSKEAKELIELVKKIVAADKSEKDVEHYYYQIDQLVKTAFA